MVEWKKLGEVCSYYRGVTYKKSQEIPFGSGGTRILRANNITLNSNKLNFDDVKELSLNVKIKDYQWLNSNDILICAGSGSKEHIGKVAYIFDTIRYAYGGFMGKIVASERLHPRFLFFVMSSQLFKKYLVVALKSTTINNLNTEIVNNFYIPIPSLPEQQRIVVILNTFTSSIDNLKQQIEQRRKQYEYYREKLLDLEGKEGVEMKTLADLGSFFGGLTGKTKEDFVEGNAKFVTYMNVFSNSALDISQTGTVKIIDGEKQNKIKKGDILFTGSSETPEEAGMSCVVTKELDGDYYINSFCFGIRLNREEQFNLDYLKHILRSSRIRKKIAKTASGVTRFNISKPKFGEVTFPIPSIFEQNRISSILDTFEDSIRNLEEQLKLREKQYEYYRNKLLTFDK